MFTEMTSRVAGVALAAVLCASPAFSQGKPDIHSPEPVFNFGNWDNETNVDHKFTIVNLGTAPLEIKNVKTSCGCTVAEPEKKLLAPGEETVVAATLKLQGKQGPQSKMISVSTNDPDEPTFQLQFQGTAVAAIMLDPMNINLGRVMDDGVHEAKVNVKTQQEDINFHITSVATELDYIETEVQTVTEGKEYNIIARNKGPLPIGMMNGMLTIHTDHPKRPTAQVRMNAQVIGAIETRPHQIVLQESDDPEKTTSQVLSLSPGRIKEFNITEIVAPLETITTEITPRGNSNFLVRVNNMPGSPDLDGKELIVKTDLADLPEVRIPFKIQKPLTQFQLPPAAGNVPKAPAPSAARAVPIPAAQAAAAATAQ